MPSHDDAGVATVSAAVLAADAALVPGGRVGAPAPEARRAPRRALRCATNIPGVDTALHQAAAVRTTPLEAVLTLPMRERFAALRALDVIAIANHPRLLMEVAGQLMAARSRARLVGIDILLPKPSGVRGAVRGLLSRLLLRRVDRFYLFQRDVVQLDRHYDIGARCEYVPFKCNVWERASQGALLPRDQGYVLHAGRTNRDLACFLAACWRTPVPTVLLLQKHEVMRTHGTGRRLPDTPPWVRVVEHDGARATFEAYLAGARVVVIAIRGDSITSTGCSTMLDALALRKCVIISDGPATRGILDTDCAVIVPSGNAAALGEAIRRCYRDAEGRRHTAERAMARAVHFGGADRLHADLASRILGRAGLPAAAPLPALAASPAGDTSPPLTRAVVALPALAWPPSIGRGGASLPDRRRGAAIPHATGTRRPTHRMLRRTGDTVPAGTPTRTDSP